MRKASRVLVLTLIAAVLLSNVAFAKTKIVQWSFPMLENEMEVLWKPFIEKFNEVYPDIEVEVEILPWAGRDERMLTAVVSGNPPDVVYLNEFFLQTFASRGALEPLNAYISEEVLLSRFPETLLSTGKVGDNYYLAPMLTGVLGNVYHREVLEKAGWDINNLPETWDEFLEFAAHIKKWADENGEQVWPIAYSASMETTLNMSWFPILWQAGGDIVTEDGKKAAFNSPEGIAAMQFVKTLADNGYIPESLITSGRGDDYFLDGRVAMIFGVDAAGIAGMRERDPEFDSYAVVGPILKGKERVTYTTLGAWAIFKNANNAEAAAKWIEFLTSPEINVEYNKKTGYMSPIIGAPKLFADDPLLGVLEEQVIYGRGGMTISQERRVMDVLKRAQQAIILGEASIEDALRSAEQEVNFILR